MTDQGFRTSADATRADQSNRSNSLSRPITARRADRIVQPLKNALSRSREEDPSTPSAHFYGYGVVELETRRTFREIDNQGRLHLIDVIACDEIDGVISYIIDAQSTGIVFPGDFPGQIRESDDIITSGRFSGVGPLGRLPLNNSQIRLFKGTQNQVDSELVEQTTVNDGFVGNRISYVWSRFTFQEGRFSGDPTFKVIARSRKVVDPRTAIGTDSFDSLTKTFAINPYRFIFDYLVRPKNRGGAGLSLARVDIERFRAMVDWGETLVDTIQFSKTAILTTDTDKQFGTPPNATNHLFEFRESVAPFQYGDVVQVRAVGDQEVPSNLSPNTDYFVIPVRHRVNDFQIPAIALADSLENSLLGISVPQGDRTKDVTITKVKEVRYQSGLIYRAGEDILPDLLRSCGARIFLNNGKISITRQVFPDTSDIEPVSIDDLFGSIALSTKINADDRATALSGSFSSITNLFTPKTYPVVSGQGVFAAQDGEEKIRDFDLLFVAKASIAQRLATVELRRLRQELTLAFSGDLRLFRLSPGTICTVDFPKYGLDSDTTFEVQNQVIFLRISSDVPTFGIDIEAKQLESSTFDLDISNEQFVDSARIPGLENPFEVQAPGAPQITEELFRTRVGAGARVRVILKWAKSPSLFITRYIVTFRRVGASTFTPLADVPGSDLTATISDLEPGFYDFRVVAVNSLGRRSDDEGAEATNIQVVGLAARPSAPVNFTGQVFGTAGVILQWTRSTDLDVLEGGQVEIRHDNLISGANAQNSVLIAGDVGGQVSIPAPFKQGTYFLRFQDSSGQFSEPASWSTQDRRPVRVAQVVSGGVLTDTAGFTIQEDNTFPSTNPGNTLIFVTDHLELPLQDTIDDEPDFDAILDIDEVGGGDVVKSGEYFSATDIELDTATRVLIEAILAIEVFDLSASIDDEPDFDQIPDIDSVASALLQPGLVTAEVQVRFSNDPISFDNFGPWEKVDTQYVEALSFQFKVVAERADNAPTANIRINQFRIRVREESL